MTRAKCARVVCSIALPDTFRRDDILRFHGRDALAVAERTAAASLQKGLTWQGRAAQLSIRFCAGRTDAELAVDGKATLEAGELANLVRRMLGLTQPVDDFERAFCDHPQVGRLIERQRGLRVPLAATPFEALTWAITGQQIGLAAAISLRRKLIQAAGLKHSAGLACYPDAARVAGLSSADLRQAGFSTTKTQTLLALSSEVAEDRLPLDAWLTAPPVEEIRDRLLRMRGIGPWTVDYALLRGFGWLDGSLHGDAAVRRQLQRLLGSGAKLDEDFTRNWLNEFSPWRALVAAHLWAMPA